MKLKYLPLAIIAAMPFAAQAEGPIDGKLYGKINLTLDMYDYEDETDATGNSDYDEWQLNSNASRIGVEGKSKLTDSLSAIYKLEWEVNTDGDGTDLKARNRYVGLTGGFGTILGGKHDTPTKLAQNKIDLFNDLYGDIKNAFEGENRVNNIVMYTTPSMGNVSGTLAFIPGEDGAADGDNGIADGKSLAVQFETDSIYVALAADKEIDAQDLVRLVGQFSFGGFTLGAMFQTNENSDNSDTIDEQGVFVSGAFKVGKGVIKAQLGKVENDSDTPSSGIEEESTISIGYDHKLAKSTMVFGYVTQNTNTYLASGDDEMETILGVGLEHKF